MDSNDSSTARTANLTSTSTQPIAILRRKAVEQITGLSKSSIYAGIQNGTFPIPIRLTANSVGWVSHEIQNWLQEKVDSRK
ncbi:AlpA family phage regulatory protein [Burkholderia multivorans]|nr:AlpA family phage regulatory protein [Burkholderia multivorans]MDN7406239.1 AlpA family phage regulatory protein [Burkholderia multivorans]MDN7414492.1 AlpA family phage regulatory protein [Burkholderia multivorans]MDN7647771.1 AlpA family phage regulatory protein [Burkholderia multivorans]MDN7684822.1 AlpA family phage regulatory protein [Burkholderia multivorans]